MPKLEAEVEFEVYCAKCGAGLCGSVTVDYRYNTPRLNVDPCEKCIDAATDNGHEEGYDEGYAEGRDQAQEAQT